MMQNVQKSVSQNSKINSSPNVDTFIVLKMSILFKRRRFHLKEDNFIKNQKQCLTNTFGFLKFMHTQVEWNRMIN